MFYIIFYYSWFIYLHLNQYKFFMFFHQILLVWVSVIIFALLIFDLFFFAFIGSVLIDTETCPRACYQIECGMYPNRTYIFASAAGLWKVVARVAVGCLDLFVSIFSFLGIKYPSSSLLKPYFVGCWLVFIMCIGSAVIDTENFPQVC